MDTKAPPCASANSSAASFRDQLQAVKDDVDETSRNFPDLSPEGKRECREHVEKTLETLSKIKKSLEDADPDVKTLQLTGYQYGPMSVEDYSRQIMGYLKGYLTHNQDEIVIERISIEENFVVDASFKMHQIKECFIRFNTAYSAEYVLGLHIPFSSDRTKLSKAKQTAATRATYRKIGGLVTRIKEIEEELKKLGAVRECNSRPKPPQNFLDRSYFAEQVPKWKRAREAGTMLDHNAYVPLKHYKMVDMQRLQSRMDALYNEECDALIRLRQFQMDGFEFDF
jgi:hypothetical protein